MNGSLRLIHAILPTTVDLRVTIPEGHPSTRNLGPERMGSGTLVAPEGYILTVNYVVLGADSITVTLSDGEQFRGELVAQDFETGLALVKIPGRDFPFMRPAPREDLSPGQAGFIAASSGDKGRRVSGGYVTSLESYDGQWEYLLEKAIRFTAFNPGFGGGTLVDFSGRMMGVVSLNLNEIAKFSLAIPIEYYVQHDQELKQYGRIRSRPPRPWLGFYPQPLAGHIVIAGVTPGGPAEKSGMQEGDIIIGVEEKQVQSRPELYREIWKKRPGERISFRILREEESVNLEVISGDRWDFYRS
ncbi:MAG: S1C family serine protease [Candidatus Binatia bacterium]